MAGPDRDGKGLPLARLLKPRSVAFVGGDAAERAIVQCRALGFEGSMWAVNPTRDEIGGLPAFPTVADLPAAPDVAFVGVNRHDTIRQVASLAEAGTGAAVCYASGFAEVGPEGESLQVELMSAAGPMRIVGPNCYGTISATSGAVLWPDEQGLARVETGVAVITQSGNIAVNLTMQARPLAIAHVMTLGNQADVSIEDCLGVIVDDPAVTGVALHIEALHDVESFADATARAHARGVPVVALKTGSSAVGAVIAASHTSSIVGDDAAYDALFERLGVRRVRTVPELLDTLHVLQAIGPLEGNRLVSLSCSGGEASLVADRAPGFGVEFPAFDDAHRDRVASTLSELVAVTNPLDYHTFIWGDERRLTDCFTAVLDGPFDAAMLVLDFPGPGIDDARWWPTLDAFAAASASTGTPGVVTSTLAETMPASVRDSASTSGLAALTDIDSALRSLEAAAWLGGRVRTGDVLPPPTPVEGRRTLLDEADAKALLARFDIPVPRGECVVHHEAVGAAARIGYPVVVKASGLAHKTDVGGVRMGLHDDESVAAAARELSNLSDELLVEEHVAGTAELLVTVRSTPPVGYLLTLGVGGTLVEVIDRTASLLLPATPEEISVALRRLPVWGVLTGDRGTPPTDLDAVIETIGHVADVVVKTAGVVEVEINPLIVGPNGATAADALITTTDPTGEP